MISTSSRHKRTPAVSNTIQVMAPLKRPASIKTVASMAIACVDVARAIGGIYLYALYRQTVGRITKRPD